MSKRHGAKKKRARKARRRILCPSCRQPADGSPAALLGALAAALNACTDGSVSVDFRHGAAYSRDGYVLPLGGGRWAARTLAYTEFTPPDDDDDDD